MIMLHTPPFLILHFVTPFIMGSTNLDESSLEFVLVVFAFDDIC